MSVNSASTQKVHIISLGCARNRVDSEVMLGTLLQDGWSLASDASAADAIIVNTCGFIESAKEESIDRILESAELKKVNPNLRLIVAGCLTQRYKKQLAKGLPEVDLFVGTDEFARIDAFLREPQPAGSIFAKRSNYLYNEAMPRVNTLSKRSAYVKVAEGCQHNCAFCMIPAIRGRLRSRPIASVVQEVRNLVAEGVLEVNLIAQDLAAYGRDWAKSPSEPTQDEHLLVLCRSLCEIEGLKWLRLLYVYPENLSDAFLDYFAREEKIVKYLDIPIQHASDRILASMDRNIDQQGLRSILGKVRAKVPNISLRSSVIVGFPGETEEDFEELLDFLREQRIDHLGCFRYSQEEGTKAARMPDQVSEEVKEERYDRLMTMQREISKENLKKYRDQTLEVLVEGPCEESSFLFQGRIAAQAPEVDGLVYLNSGNVRPGAVQNVRIVETHEYDLVGSALDE